MEEFKFVLLKPIGSCKIGKVFDCFDGLVSGVDGIPFTNKEYFRLKRIVISSKVKARLQIEYNYCRDTNKSLEYTYQSMLDEVENNDSIVIKFLKKYTDFYKLVDIENELNK